MPNFEGSELPAPSLAGSTVRAVAIAAAFLLILWSAGLTGIAAGHPIQEESEDRVLARIGDREVTRADVEERVGTELEQLDFQYRSRRHEIVDGTVRGIVRDALLQREAERRGVTVEELVDTVLEGQLEITSEQVESFYSQNRQRLGGRSLESVRPAIRQFLQQRAREQALDEFAFGLTDEFDAEILLEPFRVELTTEGKPAQGPADAPVTIVEFSDFQCPYCERLTETLERVREEYGDRVRIVFRQFPIEQLHADAPKAAEASLCAADQGEFWAMHDLMFQEQDSLAVPNLKAKAERIGLDTERFATCLDSGTHAQEVEADRLDGSAVGVTGTPAVFVNGRPVEGGAVPFERLAEIVEEELERAGG